MNWARGLRRLALGVLAAFWVFVIYIDMTGDLPRQARVANFEHAFILTGVYLVAYFIVAWVARGFTRRQ